MTQTINVSKLDEFYTFRNREEVLASLTPEKIEILRSAPAEIQKYFPHAPLFLWLYTDHEDENRQILYLLIGTKLSVNKAHDSLDQIIETWWLSIPTRNRRHMSIFLEYLDDTNEL
jgi:hypothetical protein